MSDRVALERAREQLKRASDDADRPIQTQLDSIQEGLREEIGGVRTQTDSAPKPDRIAELVEKLGGLEEKASGPARRRIERARRHCLEYLENAD